MIDLDELSTAAGTSLYVGTRHCLSQSERFVLPLASRNGRRDATVPRASAQATQARLTVVPARRLGMADVLVTCAPGMSSPWYSWTWMKLRLRKQSGTR
jgi:hypothetical protein